MWKAIFLDVACFFRGKMRDQVIEILETYGFDAKIGIQVLMDKSLLTIENDALQMHDLLQEMGMEIVRRESREEPGKRSRLWLRKDLFHVLMNNTVRTLAKQHFILREILKKYKTQVHSRNLFLKKKKNNPIYM